MSSINDVSNLKVNFTFGNIGPSDPLDSIVYCIKESMHTDKIFLIGTYPAFPSSFGLEYDLLVLIDSNYKKPMHEFESLIANRCHDLAMVTASVHKTDLITRLLQQNNIFFSNLYDPDKLIFNSGSDIIRRVGLDYSALILEQFENEFNNQYSRARSFLSGAISYRITGDNQLAAFMLHQTVEQGLNALITPLIGYRLQTHNLNKLLLYARRLSQKLYTIFPRNTDFEIQLYQILHKAYIYGRYKNSFLISKECLQLLVERSTALLEMTQTVFFEKIDELRKIKRLHI